ncbi:MAG: methyltransferase domain-containing protein [Candidatus Zixiibacteriota bacterium]|nr:MAG: methyltransferase domain-containing protein [candidate division Zixibacteria bacterium]
MRDREFDRWASIYDESISQSLNSFPFYGYFEVLSEVRDIVAPRKGLKVIDVGIGTGLLSHKLAEDGCRIYGVDFSKEMIEKAKTRIPDGEFDVVDITADHFGRFNSEKFDRVISSYCLHHLNDRQKVKFFQRTIENNLSENGKIIIADIGFETESSFNIARDEYGESWEDEEDGEYYMCGEKMVDLLRGMGISVIYKQVSSCAGILLYA